MTVKTNREAFKNYQKNVAKYQNNYADVLCFKIGYWLNAQGVKRDDLLNLTDNKNIYEYNPDTLSFTGYTIEEGETINAEYVLTKMEAYKRIQTALMYVVHVFSALRRTDLQELLKGGYYQEIDRIVLLYTYNKVTTEDVVYFMK